MPCKYNKDTICDVNTTSFVQDNVKSKLNSTRFLYGRKILQKVRENDNFCNY